MTKINSGTILLGFLAVLFGLIGTWAIREYSRKPSAPEPQPVAESPRVLVPMASRTMEDGHRIKVDDVALVKMTRKQLKEQGIDKKAFITNSAQIIGKTVKSGIRRGETFDTREFYPEGTGPGIANRLKPGQRAVTVSLTPTNALMGFAGAGQQVDVLFHYGEQRKVANEDNEPQSTPDTNKSNPLKRFQSATVTLVQNAEILALGNSVVPTDDANGISSDQRVLVTLAVNPADAEAIRVADGNGELSLTLRGPDDRLAIADLGEPRVLSEIIEIDSGVRQMEIYRGTQLTRVEFDANSTFEKSFANSRPLTPTQQISHSDDVDDPMEAPSQPSAEHSPESHRTRRTLPVSYGQQDALPQSMLQRRRPSQRDRSSQARTRR